jgi:hypothetical protein
MGIMETGADLLAKARSAMDLIREGRQALGAVVDAVKDGKAGIDAATIGEIDALFEQERIENRQTDAAIKDAIAAYRQRNPS